ncbi:hypothetical protein AMTRI_Chr01g137030 [Amborella trichopoda]
MLGITPTVLCNPNISKIPVLCPSTRLIYSHPNTQFREIRASLSSSDSSTVEQSKEGETHFDTKPVISSPVPANDEELTKELGVSMITGNEEREGRFENRPPPSSISPKIENDIKKVVQKTASTFAPRASTATKNPAIPGTTLYTVFEVQGYASMLLGGALSFNLLFPSNEPDIWRLMGMWSIWMFTIPSLRARDCSKNEKEALNYLFLLVPLLNVLLPFFWKSFSVVWSADAIAFFAMYTWKVHHFILSVTHVLLIHSLNHTCSYCVFLGVCKRETDTVGSIWDKCRR